MDSKGRFTDPVYSFLPVEAEGFSDLAGLALNMRWSWSHRADKIWRRLDAELWEQTGNPWVVLQTVSREKIKNAMADAEFRKELDEMTDLARRAGEKTCWFGEEHTGAALKTAAYFSMEFMLSEALPIYSGGLGNVAGDQLKAASDLGVPLVGVGLLYQQGYFRQVIGKDGGQEALFPYNDPGQLPITPVRGPDGEWLRLEVELPGGPVLLRAWQVEVGKVKLYLLDTNDVCNYPAHRGIASELYGGGAEMRIKQELVLGLGGWRLLKALGLDPEVCHLNEGHAAFTVLERAADFMKAAGVDFATALSVTRAGNLFTTHTPVPAGFDRFSPALMEQYLGDYARRKLGIPLKDLLALGRLDPEDRNEPFNMAYLALRCSGAVNGVSRLHGSVSRGIFQPLFPRWPREEVPVTHVTNGVHMPSWDSAEADELWTRACGQDRWLGRTGQLAENLRKVSDEDVWKLRGSARKRLIEHARGTLARQLTGAGVPAESVERARYMFNPDVLTIGFARRFAPYKRPNLLLHDRQRLLSILKNAQRPIQLILAGKAHPSDYEGQALIKEWINFIRLPEARDHIMFLSDYDVLLTERLVRGVDVWLNTPRRPWEASGTSGMKVLVNGGLNLSELDGWWVEAYSPELGWALGDGKEHGYDPAWDAAEAGQLYDILEREVAPEFYARDGRGLPPAWVARIRESAARLTPLFSASRTVSEYTGQHYLPAAENYRARAADKGALGARMLAWRRALDAGWNKLAFGPSRTWTEGDLHEFEAQIRLGDIAPEAVAVEVYSEPVIDGPPIRRELRLAGPVPGPAGTFVYRGSAPAEIPAADYTVRVIPRFKGVSVPLEAGHILWQR